MLKINAISLNKFTLFFLVFLSLCSCSEDTTQKKKTSQKKSNPPTTLFNKLPSNQTNIAFANTVTESDSMNIIKYPYFYSGGGVATGDVNNDGLLDVFLTSNQNEDKLYINKGNLLFEEVELRKKDNSIATWSTGVTMADVNGDGLLDIYVCKSGLYPKENRKNELWLNQGDGAFIESAEELGLADNGYSTQAAFFDYDRDGDLDMYLLNHQIKAYNNYNQQKRVSRHPYFGDKFYENVNGSYKEIGEKAGIYANEYGYGLGIATSDLNNDNWPDIYVTNDFLENDFMYINNQDGTFSEVIQTATKHISNFGMGVDIADVNDDGLTDVFVVDMVAKDNFRQKTNMSGMNPERFWKSIQFGFHFQYMYNTFQLNQGNLKFSEIGQMLGVSNTDWSWSCLIADFDGDTKKDFVVTNGLRKEVRNNDFVKEHMLYAHEMPKNKGLDSLTIMHNQLKAMPSNKVPNYAFQNKGSLNFKNVSATWGLAAPSFSTGASYADLDNDGDLDIIMNNVDEEAFVYENMLNSSKNYVKIRLKGTEKNPFAIGSKVTLNYGDKKQHLELFTTRGFQSSVAPELLFSLGDYSEATSIDIIWPNGKASRVENIQLNSTINIEYAKTETERNQISEAKTVFSDVTKQTGIDFIHYENEYDDFSDQVLLPHKLSKLGPAVAVGDVNGDNLEDVLFGGAHTISPVLFIQRQNGSFSKKENPIPEHYPNFEDVVAEFFDVDNDGDLDLYMGSGGYEFLLTTGHLADRIYLNDGLGNFKHDKKALPDFQVSTSCIRPHDYDNDGDLDLFIGGRVYPKKYPMAPRSYILENNKGKYTDVTRKKASKIARIGMVTDAEWTDLDGDQIKELIVVGEWMPISVFKLDTDTFKMLNAPSTGLEKTEGWWFSISSADIDNDGDYDLIAGNLGQNYKYKATPTKPFKLYANDFDNNQKVDIVLSYPENGVYYPVRGRECSSQQLPHLKKKFPNYYSFAKASVKDVLGAQSIRDAEKYNVYSFEHAVFMNENGKLKKQPLNRVTQLSAIDDILIDDLNKDGKIDLITAGNLYTSEVETPRADASYGNILLGEGDGSFKSIKTQSTSHFGEGDVKKIIPINTSNGKLFLIVRNSGALKVFKFN